MNVIYSLINFEQEPSLDGKECDPYQNASFHTIFLSVHTVFSSVHTVFSSVHTVCSSVSVKIFRVIFLGFFVLTFFENSFRNNIRVSNSLDPDQARRFVGPDLGPIFLPRLSAEDESSH